jgi:hypothetical protein
MHASGEGRVPIALRHRAIRGRLVLILDVHQPRSQTLQGS